MGFRTANRKYVRLLIGIGAAACVTALVVLLLVGHHLLLPRVFGAPGVGHPSPEPPCPGFAHANAPGIHEAAPPADHPALRTLLEARAEAGIVRYGDRRSNMVALTFDDGPHPAYTAHELAILDRYGVKATFFVVGTMAQKYPDSVRAIHDAGHVVGNHTWDHPTHLGGLPDIRIKAELAGCSSVLFSILGEYPSYCRPPGCSVNSDVVLCAADEGMKVVLYTVNSGDYTYPGKNVILGKILSKVRGGDIILMHDGVNQTIDILPKLIETLQSRGFELVTIEELDKSAHGPGAG